MRLPAQLRILLPFALSGALIFANAAPTAAASPGLGGGSVTLISEPIALANAVPEDGWYLAAPYGDVKHKGPGGADVIQRFVFSNAKAVVADFKGLVARILDGRFGTANLPVYYGHPDDVGWAMSNASADQTVYTRVQDMEARPDGLWVKFQDWIPDFSKLPAGLGLSPRWIALPNATEPGVFEPVKIISIGLWTTPKIPGTSLVNADAVGPPDPSVSDLQAQIAALTATITTLTQERDDLKQRYETANRSFDAKWQEANTYKAAMANLLARDYVSFRNAITPAEEPALVASLVNATTPAALEAILTPLHHKAIALPNGHTAAGKVAGRQANPDAGAAKSEFSTKVSEKMGTGLSYSEAWTSARATNAELFKTAYPNG
jgi:hypothetical protein